MKNKIRFCDSCGRYTMKSECEGTETRIPHPPKYSEKDYAAKYRRKGL